MHIDWGQIVTQAIGFLLAVWLLKRYAWSSLLGFVEKRRETIATAFEEIEREKAENAEQKRQYDLELESIEATRREKIQVAAAEAEKLGNDIKEEARRDAMVAREKSQRDIEVELDKANEVLKDQIVDAVFIATEKLLGERLDKAAHSKLVNKFLDEVKVK
jgi:F-type H+-transporting ATPase subunit b